MFRRKEKPKDAFQRLNDKIDKLYAENPYTPHIFIAIYLAELEAITRSSIIGFYPSFNALLNKEIIQLYFRGVCLTLAPHDSKKYMTLGKDVYADDTNLEK